MKNLNFSKLINGYPENISQLFIFLITENIKPTIVGGSVRDFILNQSSSKDIDVEIRFDEKQIDLFKLVSTRYKAEQLQFGVIRIIEQDYEIELTPPREENYDDSFEVYDHSSFEVDLNSELTYMESFKRRDFTINSLGIELSYLKNDQLLQGKLIDPFDGLTDIKNKMLRTENYDFDKDPVRFLRAIRFKIKYEFSLNKDLKERLSCFVLDQLTKYYFFYEAEKVNKVIFINELSKFKVSFPEDFDILMSKTCEMKIEAKTWDDILFDIIDSEKYMYEELVKVANFLNIKEKKVSEYIDISKILKKENNSKIIIGKKEIEDVEINLVNKLSTFLRYNTILSKINKYPYQLRGVAKEKITFAEHIIKELKSIKSSENYVANIRKLDDNLRSIYALFLYLRDK